jgi:predicted site-specific integrase-resolvase
MKTESTTRPSVTPVVYSLPEMATASGLALQTLYGWSSKGLIPWPTFKIGRRVLALRTDVEAYLLQEARSQNPTVKP